MLTTALVLFLQGAAPAAPPLEVCATTPNLGALAREIGGERIELTVFAKGTEDPHFVEIRPSHVRRLHDADLLLAQGLALEIGWLPSLIDRAKNPRIRPGRPGYLDCSEGIEVRARPTGRVDRSSGDIHPFGNPHYLLDPLNGRLVAIKLRDRFTKLRPEFAGDFQARFASFDERLGRKLVGDALYELYPYVKLMPLWEHHRLVSFLNAQGDRDKLGGWLGRMLALRGTRALAEHDIYRYFAARFGIEILGFLEPVPGVPPTTRHLARMIALARERHVTAILTVSYYDPRHARFVAEHTGAKIVPLAHQVGARKGADDYLSMIDFNVRTLADTLSR